MESRQPVGGHADRSIPSPLPGRGAELRKNSLQRPLRPRRVHIFSDAVERSHAAENQAPGAVQPERAENPLRIPGALALRQNRRQGSIIERRGRDVEIRQVNLLVVDPAPRAGGVGVGRNARIRRAIIDKDVRIPMGFEIGWNREADLARGFTVTEDGIIVVAKGEELERFG